MTRQMSKAHFAPNFFSWYQRQLKNQLILLSDDLSTNLYSRCHTFWVILCQMLSIKKPNMRRLVVFFSEWNFWHSNQLNLVTLLNVRDRCAPAYAADPRQQCTKYLNIEYMTQASIFSPPQLASSLLDSVAEVQRVQVSTCRSAVNLTQPKHSQDCLNVSTLGRYWLLLSSSL